MNDPMYTLDAMENMHVITELVTEMYASNADSLVLQQYEAHREQVGSAELRRAMAEFCALLAADMDSWDFMDLMDRAGCFAGIDDRMIGGVSDGKFGTFFDDGGFFRHTRQKSERIEPDIRCRCDRDDQ